MDQIEHLCHEPLWNTSVSWNTANPNLSKCLRHTFLIWLPSLLLLVISSYEILHLIALKGTEKWRSSKVSTRSWLMLSRLSLIFLLLIMVVAEGSLVYQQDSATTTSLDHLYFALFATMLLIEGVLVYFHRCVFQWSSSSMQLVYWLVMTACLTPTLKTAIDKLATNDGGLEAAVAACQLVQYICCVVLLVLEHFPYPDLVGVSSEDTASFSSRLVMSWLQPLFRLGYRGKAAITASDLPLAGERAQLDNVLQDFEHHWKNKERRRNDAAVNIVPVLARTYWKTMAVAATLKIVSMLLSFALPQILRVYILEISDDDVQQQQNWKGYFLSSVLFVVALAQVTCLNQYFHFVHTCGLQMRTAVFAAIYGKSLRLSAASRAKHPSGEIANYLSVDCQRFASGVQYLNFVWAGPLEIALAVSFLYELVGVSALAGVAVLLLCIPVNAVSMTLAQRMEAELMKAKDGRIRILNEALLGIKALKLYAWESVFLKRLFVIRETEVRCLKKCAVFWSNMNACFSICPILVTLVTFGTYIQLDPAGNVLTAEKVFACMILFNIIRSPMYFLPMSIMDLMRLGMSVRRINSFLSCEELTADAATALSDDSRSSNNAVEFTNASLTWGDATAEEEDSPDTLRNIHLHLKRGSLTAVLGKVGAGKSSLLLGLLGEMRLTQGNVSNSGEVSYVPQQAWIQNATLRENILFGRPFDQQRYQSVIRSCALEKDFSTMPSGDMTEIGENGVNLSGGQKQRVSLARASYGEQEIVLLDDPLSAVDGQVAEHLFRHCIGPDGALAGKTRILVTHNLTFLDKVDRIVLLENGEVVADGSYVELCRDSSRFRQHVQSLQLNEIKAKSDESDDCDVDRTATIDSQGDKLVEEEATSTGRVSIKHYLYFFKKANVFVCLLILLTSLASNICNTSVIVLLSEWTNSASFSSSSSSSSYFFTLFGIIILLTGLFCYAENISLYRRCAHVSGVLHDSALRAVFGSPMSFFHSTPTGRIVNRFSGDVDVLDQKIPREISISWYFTLNIVLLLILSAYFIPVTIALQLPILVAGCFLQVYSSRCKRQLQRIEFASKSPILSFFAETVQGMSVIRAFGAQERFVSENRQRLGSHLHCSYINMAGSRWLSVRVDYLGCAFLLATSILATYHRPDVSTSVCALLITLSIAMLEYLGYTLMSVSDLEADSVSLERVREYEGLEGEVGKEEGGEGTTAAEVVVAAASYAWLEDGSIRFDDYSARYREGQEDVIKGLNLDVRHAEKIGICGRTGAGKSSLALALFRLVETSGGRILISGRDIATLGLQELRSRITIIPQDPILFSGSLRFNLDPTDSHSDADIWDAVRHARLEETVKRKKLGEKGLDLEVGGDGGTNFSVGERQLVCLARALLRKSKILVLDEATAAMDSDTDAAIQRTIQEEFRDCTVLTVAHRLDTIRNSDRVVVMDQGRMVECDEPDILMADENSSFCKMMSLNAGRTT